MKKFIIRQTSTFHNWFTLSAEAQQSVNQRLKRNEKIQIIFNIRYFKINIALNKRRSHICCKVAEYYCGIKAVDLF